VIGNMQSCDAFYAAAESEKHEYTKQVGRVCDHTLTYQAEISFICTKCHE
jgi:hypothetical protein